VFSQRSRCLILSYFETMWPCALILHDLHSKRTIFAQTVKKEWWISYFEIREEMDKIIFLTIRHFYIFFICQTTNYNSI
jgi:hypothetical protein